MTNKHISLDDLLTNDIDYSYEFNKKIKASGMISISDTHGNYEIIGEALDVAKKEGLVLAYNGDNSNDYKFEKLAYDIGIKTQQQIVNEYLVENLSDQDMDAVYFMQNISVYGMDSLLNSIPENQRNEAQEHFNGILNYAQSELFQIRIQKLDEKLLEEKGDQINQSIIQQRALYEVFVNEEAKSFAKKLNENKEVNVLFNHGNHENSYFAYMVSRYLDNPDQIIDMNRTKGYIVLEDDDGIKTNIAGVTNTVHLMPYLQQLYSPNELSKLLSHTGDGNENSYIEGSLEENLINSKDYNDNDYKRIKEGNETNSLDILLSHGQVGHAMFDDNNIANSVPYLASAGKLALEAKYRIEGHIHNSYFDNKNNIARAVGSVGSITKKNKDGEISNERIDFKSEYRDINEPMDMDIEYIRERVNDVLLEYSKKDEESYGKAA